MRVINIKGEDFDATGVPVLDLSKYDERKQSLVEAVLADGYSDGWHYTIYHFQFPLGKFVVPVRHPSAYSFYQRIQECYRGDMDRILKTVGFQVDEEKVTHRIVEMFQPYIEAWAKKVAHRKERAKVDTKLKTDSGSWSKPGSLLIPEIGTVLRLERQWAFQLHNEYRNQGLIELLGHKFKDDYYWERDHKKAPAPWQVVINAGALLTVDRLYVRKGASDFSSLTFILRPEGEPVINHDGKTLDCKGKGGFKRFGVSGSVRFWAKLEDVNTMYVSAMMETVKRKEGKS